MEVWRVPQGSAEVRQVTICDAAGDPIAYAGTEQLAAAVWAGNDLAPLLELAPTWSTPAAGDTIVSLSEAQTAGLATGQYRLRCTVTDLISTRTYFEAVLAIVAAPGLAVARPTYIDVTDLRKVDVTIEDAQDPEGQLAGFADQCADAREWLDECILRNYRGNNISLLGYHGLALDAWYTGGGRRTASGNIWLKQQLRDNRLMVSARIRRVSALYACHLIYDSSKNRGKEYQALAARFLHQAHQLLASTVCELNLNGDGVTPHLAISMSATNTLFS